MSVFNNIQNDSLYIATYKESFHKVRWLDYDGTVLKEEEVGNLMSASPPSILDHAGLIFDRWYPNTYYKVTEPTDFIAGYIRENSSGPGGETTPPTGEDIPPDYSGPIVTVKWIDFNGNIIKLDKMIPNKFALKQPTLVPKIDNMAFDKWCIEGKYYENFDSFYPNKDITAFATYKAVEGYVTVSFWYEYVKVKQTVLKKGVQNQYVTYPDYSEISKAVKLIDNKTFFTGWANEEISNKLNVDSKNIKLGPITIDESINIYATTKEHNSHAVMYFIDENNFVVNSYDFQKIIDGKPNLIIPNNCLNNSTFPNVHHCPALSKNGKFSSWSPSLTYTALNIDTNSNAENVYEYRIKREGLVVEDIYLMFPKCSIPEHLGTTGDLELSPYNTIQIFNDYDFKLLNPCYKYGDIIYDYIREIPINNRMIRYDKMDSILFDDKVSEYALTLTPCIKCKNMLDEKDYTLYETNSYRVTANIDGYVVKKNPFFTIRSFSEGKFKLNITISNITAEFDYYVNQSTREVVFIYQTIVNTPSGIDLFNKHQYKYTTNVARPIATFQQLGSTKDLVPVIIERTGIKNYPYRWINFNLKEIQNALLEEHTLEDNFRNSVLTVNGIPMYDVLRVSHFPVNIVKKDIPCFISKKINYSEFNEHTFNKEVETFSGSYKDCTTYLLTSMKRNEEFEVNMCNLTHGSKDLLPLSPIFKGITYSAIKPMNDFWEAREGEEYYGTVHSSYETHSYPNTNSVSFRRYLVDDSVVLENNYFSDLLCETNCYHSLDKTSTDFNGFTTDKDENIFKVIEGSHHDVGTFPRITNEKGQELDAKILLSTRYFNQELLQFTAGVGYNSKGEIHFKDMQNSTIGNEVELIWTKHNSWDNSDYNIGYSCFDYESMENKVGNCGYRVVYYTKKPTVNDFDLEKNVLHEYIYSVSIMGSKGIIDNEPEPPIIKDGTFVGWKYINSLDGILRYYPEYKDKKGHYMSI